MAEKTSLYLLSIVGIVAVVGVIVLVLNVGKAPTYVGEEEALAGEATGGTRMSTCRIYCTDDPTCFYSRTQCGSLQWSSVTTKTGCSIGEEAMWAICSEDDVDGDGDGYDYAFSFWGRLPLDYYS